MAESDATFSAASSLQWCPGCGPVAGAGLETVTVQGYIVFALGRPRAGEKGATTLIVRQCRKCGVHYGQPKRWEGKVAPLERLHRIDAWNYTVEGA